MTDKCCEDCQRLKAYRTEILTKIEDVMKGIDLRPGTADCDVNALALDIPKGKAMRALELAHETVGKMFDAIGATT